MFRNERMVDLSSPPSSISAEQFLDLEAPAFKEASRSTKMFPFLLKRHICFLWLVFWVPNKRCFEMKGCWTWLTSPSSSICAKQFLDFEVPAFRDSQSFNEDVSISLETATFECKMWQVLYIFSPKTFSRMKLDRHI